MRTYPSLYESEEEKREREEREREEQRKESAHTAANNNSNELDDKRRNWTDAHDTGSIPEGQTLSLTDDYRKLKEGHRLMETETEPGDMEPPKSISEKIAKTTEGRAIQDYAGVVRDEVQGAVGLGQFLGEGEEREKDIDNNLFKGAIVELAQLLYTKKNDHEIHVRKNLKSGELAELKHALENIKLPGTKEKGKRQKQLETVNRLLGEIELMIEPERVDRIKDNIIKILPALHDVYEKTFKARLFKKWDELQGYNEECIRLVKRLHTNMVDLSEKAPDELVNIMENIASTQPKEMIKVYKTALIQFAETHALPKLSEEVLMYLKGEQKNNKRGTFAEALLKAYLNKPQYDNPVKFIKAISRIPEDKFDRIYSKRQETMREISNAA